jgi:hypothetical protein
MTLVEPINRARSVSVSNGKPPLTMQCGNWSATALASWQSGTSAASSKREQKITYCYVVGKRDSLGPSGKEFNQSTIIKYINVRVPEHDMAMLCL